MKWAFGIWFLMCSSQVLSQNEVTRKPKIWGTTNDLKSTFIYLNDKDEKVIMVNPTAKINKWGRSPSTRLTVRPKKRRTTDQSLHLSKASVDIPTYNTRPRGDSTDKATEWEFFPEYTRFFKGGSTKRWDFTSRRVTWGPKIMNTTTNERISSKRYYNPTGKPTRDEAAAWIWKKILEKKYKTFIEKNEADKAAPKKLSEPYEVPEQQEGELQQYVQESSAPEWSPPGAASGGVDSPAAHLGSDEYPKYQEVFTVKDSNGRQHITIQWQRGIVPFQIDTEIYDDIIIKRILHAMKIIESASCVSFKDISPTYRTRRTVYRLPYVHITNPEKKRDCTHKFDLGNNGEAILVLGFDCMQTRDIIHSLMHALGFMDEITHPQRDAYVRVLWENIQPKYRYLFALQNVSLPHKTLVEYDTMSIMHFHDRAYSINGGATIVPTVPGLVIQPSKSLSQIDKMKLRLAFGQECNKRKVEDLVETCKFALGDNGQTPNSGQSYEQYSLENGHGKINDLVHDTENIDNVSEYNNLFVPDDDQDDYQKNAIDSDPNAIDNGSDYNQQNADNGQYDNQYTDQDNGLVDNQEEVSDNGQGDS